MSRPTTTNYSLKKSLPSDPENVCGVNEHWGPLMDANLDALDTAIKTLDVGNVVSARTKNTVLAGPASGADHLPTFRALVAADVPAGTDPGSLTNNSGGAAADGTIAAVRSDTVAHAASDANDAITELASKVNAILAALRIAGVIV